MNRLSKLALANLLCFSMASAFADDAMNQYNGQQTAANTEKLAEYLVNLGGYLGFTITKAPGENNNSGVTSNLLDANSALALPAYALNTFLGALPVNAFNAALMQIFPSELSSANLNAFANAVFSAQNYSNPSSQQQGKVSVAYGVDQQNYQPDPVNQTVLNILGTPDMSYCMDYDGTKWVGCTQSGNRGSILLPGSSIMANIIGNLPSTYQYFTYEYNQQFLSQLNSNTLTGPMMYSSQGANVNSTSSPSANPQNKGLAAQNQAQQAANFIRYVSGSTSPLRLPNLKAYDTLYSQAIANNNGNPTLEQVQAQATLNNYFTGLRTYAAQFSVGISNLYFIMAKRLPQNQSGSSKQEPSSQALSEFNMATWRLFKADMSIDNQWVSKLNNASPATVQKEIATLLAEINYQLYLDRQIQERILMTNSIMLLQNTRSSQPNNNFTGSTSVNANQ